MKEIEILVEVYDNIQYIKDALKKYQYVGKKHIIDEYYYDPKRKDLQPDENNRLLHCLRLRNKNGEYYITYKDDIFENGKWIYSDEYETEVKSIEILREILQKLGLKKFIEIDNIKEIYKSKKYEIVIENVKNLGVFLEVEHCGDSEINVKIIKKEIQEFINSLNIKVSDELNMGKPEMYLRKKGINI